jgi:hypothetical protein
MFSERALSGELAAVRDAHAPDALVLDCERDFETLDPAVAEELGLLVDGLDPASYDPDWVPEDAPGELHRYAGSDFTIGMPEDGGVTWTYQTDPPVLLVKPRLETSPGPFVDFLVAEALVETGLDVPEHFLAFFEDNYRALSDAVPLAAPGVYQLAAALYTAYVGLQTREVFTGWDEEYPDLHKAWADAGERLDPRLSELSSELAMGQTDFPAAAELACSAVKHGRDLPAPFAALDSSAYAQHGPSYAVEWARKTFEKLSDEDSD